MLTHDLPILPPMVKLRALHFAPNDWQAIITDFGKKHSLAARERLCVLFLNANEAVISARKTDWGECQTLNFPIRALVAHGLAQNCHSIVLAHNHPSGDPRPSRADIEITRSLARALAPLEIAIKDHVIVSRNGQFSFRATGLL